ncbi:hypothetical protein DEFDS_1220 [Deferribacter desulfuricans SSM1]|uniref:Uncharacterized protein n=1 Tax=Deferribacter desulfuricans (strain DSM 14783 / JCM 11476 / NBRC 101012 / SSM1) TaxID=639282 RepID=D3PDL5_DEFDS|nr:hypothetical protein DEFDS_1220 [Deferribacter desulfuricans SSM1]
MEQFSDIIIVLRLLRQLLMPRNDPKLLSLRALAKQSEVLKYYYCATSSTELFTNKNSYFAI